MPSYEVVSARNSTQFHPLLEHAVDFGISGVRSALLCKPNFTALRFVSLRVFGSTSRKR